MNTDSPRPRRTLGAGKVARVTVALEAPTDACLTEICDRYNVARGTVAREAIDAGLVAVADQLRRAARASARTRHVEVGK